MEARKKTGADRATSDHEPAGGQQAGDHDHRSHDHGAHDHGGGGHGGHDEACPECVIAAAHAHDHTRWDHFPSDAELEQAGILPLGPPESELSRLTAARRFEPVSLREPVPAPAELVTERRLERYEIFRPLPLARDTLRPGFSRGVLNLISSYRRVRRNEATMGPEERDALNAALVRMDTNPAWQTLLDFHAGGIYRMHAIHGPIGRQRFLSWHRRYLFEAEELLRTVDTTLTIPYWDYVQGSNRPSWVHQPPAVSRPTPGASGVLPNGGTISTVLARGDYTAFTTDLENNAHNQVHNWCGGTIRTPSTASFDPIFWMLHANADRLWSVWQESHTDPVLHTPSLAGAERVLDPWSATLADVDDTAWDLGYRYG